MSTERRPSTRGRGRLHQYLAWTITAAIAGIALLGMGLSAPTTLAQSTSACGQRGTQDLFLMAADGGVAENLTNSGTFNYLPAWSRDGTEIAFMTTRDCNAEIYLINADGTEPRNISNSPDYDSFPTWAPDGSRAAFAVSAGANPEIYVVDTAGGDRINLTNDPAADLMPAWSVDGTRLAFSSNRDLHYQIHLMDVADPDRGVVQLTESPVSKGVPSWSPDGNSLAYVTAEGAIRIVNDTGTSDIVVVDEAARAQDVAWSPADDRLAFTSDMDGNQEIYSVDLDGQELVNLTNHPAADSSPAWSPDGKQIVFSSGRYVAPAAGSEGRASPVADGAEATAVDDLFDCASRIEVTSATTWDLRSDCKTDSMIIIQDGISFDGHGHKIWVVEPRRGPFVGSVIRAAGGAASVANVTIDGSSLTLDCQPGQALRGVQFSAVEGSISNVTVEHLTRGPETGCGIGILVDGPETVADGSQLANTTVESSTVRDVGSIGIFVWDSVNATITGNLVSDTGDRGISFFGPGATGTVSGNVVERAGNVGIGVEGGPGLVITDNTVLDSTNSGIAVQGGATLAQFERNRIEGGQFGIAFENEATTGTAIDNEISGTLTDGIVALSGAEATVSDNGIAEVGRAGVASRSGSTVTATGNRIYRAGRGLVVAEAGSNGRYRDNVVNDSADFGVSVEAGAAATLRDNTISGGKFGIGVSGANSTAMISTTTITGPAGFGVGVLDQARSTVSGNSIRDVGAAGVHVSGAGTEASVEGNTVSNAQRAGIFVTDKAVAEVRENVVTRSDSVSPDQPTAGIVIQAGASADIVGNSIDGYVDNGPRDACGILILPDVGAVHLKGNLFPASDESRNLCYPGADEVLPGATPV